ncbi:MAG: cyclic nucleotide-binding domain-containing protein [Bdellovibrionales bacterium]|nr:cyclic nucleotide-binding domain-containing protein [Bdellovibrionales bacterium]
MPSGKKILEFNDIQINEVISSISFFDRFPPEVTKKIVANARMIEYGPGSIILEQGTINENLYFLVTGQMTVVVDGGVVAKLRRRGDIIGEMSVLSKEPVAATIITETPTQLFVIYGHDFNSAVQGTENIEFRVLMYERYAISLTSKLRETNHKAKVVEEVNRALEEAKNRLENVNSQLEIKVADRTKDLKQKTLDLMASHQKLETKNAELLAGHAKMSEILAAQEVIFHKLENLEKDQLIPLEDSLKNLIKAQKKDELEFEVNRVLKSVHDLKHHLEPIVNRISAAQNMISQKVLLADPEKKQQVIAKMALMGTGVELDIVASKEEGLKMLKEKSYNIILVDLSLINLAEAAFDLSPHSKFVFMTSEPLENCLDQLQSSSIFPNIVSRNMNDRSFTIKNIMTTVVKLSSTDIFGLEKYLLWGADVQEEVVTSSDTRAELIEHMDAYFSKAGIRRSKRDACSAVVEELLMNAIYDAPLDDGGNSKYNQLERTVTVKLEPKEYGKIRYATDGMHMAVSVEDPFGGLTQNKVLAYLETCYSGKAGSLNTEKGGAGRGLHQIIEGADLVVFNVTEGYKTEVIAIFEVSPDKSVEKHPSLHFFHQ